MTEANAMGHDDPRDPVEQPLPWSKDAAQDEPEPDWADQIRRARRSRGERLKDVFATFGDEDHLNDPPAKAPGT